MPLYHHANRQKIIPIPNLMDVTKYTTWYQADYTFQQTTGSPDPTMLMRYNASNGFTGYGLNFLAYQSTSPNAKTATLKFKSNNIVGGSMGIVFRNSTSGKVGGFLAETYGPITYGGKLLSSAANYAYGYGYGWGRVAFNDPPTNSIAVPHEAYQHSVDTWYWLRIVDDGTNLTPYYSTDGVSFVSIALSTTRTALSLQTCDQVGLLQTAGYASTANGGWGSGAVAGSAGYGGNNYTIASFTCV